MELSSNAPTNENQFEDSDSSDNENEDNREDFNKKKRELRSRTGTKYADVRWW